ncbi:MAG: hypothetical protein K2Q09_06965 [Phycisphaerales bacterium]|nr:hypothetical protein [Phycisphaerales bacterium]
MRPSSSFVTLGTACAALCFFSGAAAGEARAAGARPFLTGRDDTIPSSRDSEWQAWAAGEWKRLQGVERAFPQRLTLYEWTVGFRELPVHAGARASDSAKPGAKFGPTREQRLHPARPNTFRCVFTASGKRFSNSYAYADGSPGLQDFGVDGGKVWTWAENQAEVWSKSRGLEKNRDYDRAVDEFAAEGPLRAYLFGMFRFIRADKADFTVVTEAPTRCTLVGEFQDGASRWRAHITAVEKDGLRWFETSRLELADKDGRYVPVGESSYLAPLRDPHGTLYASVIETPEPAESLIEVRRITGVRTVTPAEGEALVAAPSFHRAPDSFREVAADTRIFDNSSGTTIEISREPDAAGQIDPTSAPTEKKRLPSDRAATRVAQTYQLAGYALLAAIVVIAVGVIVRRRLTH